MTDTPQLAIYFISLGSLLIAGLAAQWLGQRTAIPRVSLLIGLGILAGPTGLDLLGEVADYTFPWISTITLAMVGFLLGAKLHFRQLRQKGNRVLSCSIWVTVGTWLTVTLLAGFFTGQWPLAVLLGAVATATDPAATRDVISESGISNPFTDRLLGIVALDDVWGLLLFSVSAAIAAFMANASFAVAWDALWELAGAVSLGLALGLPIAWLTGRSSDGEPLLIEALGAVILCAGLAQWLNVSYLLACIVMGTTVSNVARHHNRPFHAIHQIEWPFMMLFFILAGASLDLQLVAQLGWLGVIYVGARIVGRIAGGVVAEHRSAQCWRCGVTLGGALLPQAGVAIGIALIASQAFPHYADALLTTAIAGTVIFEILGPPLTRLSIKRAEAEPEQQS